MPPSNDRVWQIAKAVLAAVVDGYAAESVALPARQFVSPGLPAWDCDILAVQATRTFGHAGNVAAEIIDPQTPSAGHAMRGVALDVHLIRCVPTTHDDGTNISVPSVIEEEAAAEVILTDAQLLLNVLVAAQRAGDLPGCSGLAFEQWRNLGPSGGLGGGVLTVRVQVGAW